MDEPEIEQFNLANRVAQKAHYYQKRRDGKTPYMKHVRKVQSNVRARNGDKCIHVDETVALLHDVPEDFKYTKTSLEDLRELGFSKIVLDAVDALTHRDGETYEESILRAKANPIARKVKIADNLANLSDTPTNKQILKYAKSLQVLLAD